jgi:hypothetical protein
MVVGLLFSSLSHAIEYYADVLYWQASETVDWSLTNNLSLPNQRISYNTIAFHFAPGFRIGAGMQNEAWIGRLLYTYYHVNEHDSTQGNVISAFLPGKFAESIYQTGQVNFVIDFHMVDFDLYKQINLGEQVIFRPLIGLKAGAIKQQVNTRFQGTLIILEKVSNDFSGAGPKVGIDGQWIFYTTDNIQYSLAGEVSSAFMWGKWSIRDSMTQNNSPLISSVQLGKRNMGALQLQGLVGLKLQYKNATVKIGYEVSDWFNQYQVFDDGTGTHTNDLVLQGLTVAMTIRS